jgi:hypothetical protein
MIRFFKTTQAATLFFIPVFVFLLWAQAFFRHPSVKVEEGMVLNQLLLSFLSGLPNFITLILSIALVSIEAIYLNVLVNRHEVLYKNSYLPALMYALLMSLSSANLVNHPVIFSNLFLLLALDRIFSLFKNESPISPLFDSGFLISIASLFYFPVITIFPLFLIALLILRPFSLREWMIALIGFFLPWFFYCVFLFWTDQLGPGLKNIFINIYPALPSLRFTLNKPMIALLIFLGILSFLSINGLRRNFYKNVIRTRVNQQILVLYFLIVWTSAFFIKDVLFYHLTMFAIPLSVFFGNLFLGGKSRLWIPEVSLWILIGLIIWNHF